MSDFLCRKVVLEAERGGASAHAKIKWRWPARRRDSAFLTDESAYSSAQHFPTPSNFLVHEIVAIICHHLRDDSSMYQDDAFCFPSAQATSPGVRICAAAYAELPRYQNGNMRANEPQVVQNRRSFPEADRER